MRNFSRNILLTALVLSGNVFSYEVDPEFLSRAKDNIDLTAGDLAKALEEQKDSFLEKYQSSIAELEASSREIIEEALDAPCENCRKTAVTEDSEDTLKLFISFSVPDSFWLESSKELERIGGAFILRGIPDNSFNVFAKNVLRLRKMGVLAPIRVDPKSFERNQIEVVPTFVQEGSKVSGMLSLDYVLTLFGEDNA
jgi:type-F conjugative transfer system pilin assembly protein TrbC